MYHDFSLLEYTRHGSHITPLSEFKNIEQITLLKSSKHDAKCI